MAPNSGEPPRTHVKAGSPEYLDRASELFQLSVRRELDNIILAMVVKKPMCGIDIIKTIHVRFGLLLSPGTIYPLLHDLEKKGLLFHVHEAKVKIYRPANGMSDKISDMLRERVKVGNSLNKFFMTPDI